VSRLKRKPTSSAARAVLAGALTTAALFVSCGRDASSGHARGPLPDLLGPGALPGFVIAAEDKGRDATSYTLTNGAALANIDVLEHIKAADAETLTRDGVMGMQALYANALSPYPGDISNKVVTDPAFQPRLFQATNGALRFTYLLVHANDRFGYGVTTKESVRYKSLVGMFFCAARESFFKVKLFMPPGTPDSELVNLLTGMQCGITETR
jgi:hypothetical protein